MKESNLLCASDGFTIRCPTVEPTLQYLGRILTYMHGNTINHTRLDSTALIKQRDKMVLSEGNDPSSIAYRASALPLS